MLSSSIACLGALNFALSIEIARNLNFKIAAGSTGGVFGGGWYKNVFSKLLSLGCT